MSILTTGQITPDSPFGKALTKYARESRRILEVGTGSGLGSTQCLIAGMEKGSVLQCVEADYEQLDIARQNVRPHEYKDFDVWMWRGCFHKIIRPYFHPIDEQCHREEYDNQAAVLSDAPILDFQDYHWDMVLLDGGEWTSDADFLMLWNRTTILALDDLNPKLATKNCYATDCCKRAGWTLLEDGINDRNGWQIWKRP